ncbi:hypothetical protein Bca52824_007033 [Brassica carinata]|uniref:F-box associated beta-propeller type 3 domain-containing protein n=1 Tax=Brassica carinata TaxID=52824 RepID=A0A8X7W8B8_BRACI|nr:hypothetical protein Bca52824_007033 [Brassica carinata]
MDKLPEEMVYDILQRCPAKAVERCLDAFPAFTALVRSPSFSTDFCLRSLPTQQDRVLFATTNENMLQETRTWIFNSSSTAEQEEESTLLLSTTTLPLHDHRQNKYMNYSAGLLCSGSGKNPIIYNPTNGEHRVLPGVIFGQKEVDVVRCFLGFSRVSGFNVIAVVKDACQMLALDTMAWKPIKCNHLPSPETASVSIEGSIYYAAYETPPRTMVLIIFNIETELFRIVKIPQAPMCGLLLCEKIMNVDGKVGICFVVRGGKREVKILENSDEESWSTRTIESPRFPMNDVQHFPLLSFEGFTRHGETIFSQDVSSSKALYYCDLDNESYRKEIKTIALYLHQRMVL